MKLTEKEKRFVRYISSRVDVVHKYPEDARAWKDLVDEAKHNED